ncbi:Glycosyl transferase [Burkholderiales bacterium 8X]|nr:Glycosyl transferase [Burkholderiales bacterium 8X]
MIVSVGIKALNEQERIASCVHSASNATDDLAFELVLADSGSSDKTIEIAKGFRSLRIFTLADPSQRSCGVGAQLAFQHSSGDFFYILDGDMIFHPGFLKKCVDYLVANPDVAAVGGRVNERVLIGHDYQIRISSGIRDKNRLPGIVERLEGGGLYRTSAINDVGYFADRNLHAFEEFELGARLRAKGWKLARIDEDAADHFGHAASGYRLLWRRFTSGYAHGPGEVLRASLWKPHFRYVLKELGHIKYGFAVLAWWMVISLCLSSMPIFAPILIVIPALYLCIRRKSISLGLYSFCSWNVNALGLVAGLAKRRESPYDPIGSIAIQEGAFQRRSTAKAG